MIRKLLAGFLALGLLVSNGGWAQEVSAPVVVQEQTNEGISAEERTRLETLGEDFTMGMFFVFKTSLYQEETTLDKMKELYVVAFEKSSEILKKSGNELITSDEFRAAMDVSVAEMLIEFEKNPTEFDGKRELAILDGYGKAFIMNVPGRMTVSVSDDKEGSLEEALVESFATVTKKIGDYYAAFMPPKLASEFEDRMNNVSKLSGIGARLGLTPSGDGLEVISTFTGSPAHLIGLLPGDQVVDVDGKPVVAKTIEDVGPASERIKGEAGTTVKLKIKRGEEMLDFNILRQPIKGTDATAYRHGDVLHVILSEFDNGAAERIQRAIDLATNPGDPITGIILDLRYNGGGVMDEATQVYDLFEKKDVTVFRRTDHHVEDLAELDNPDDEGMKIVKTKDDNKIDATLVVLINGYSASASEILAGALQDNKRAIIVGSKSFGKGIYQGSLDLSQFFFGPPLTRSMIKLTQGEFFVGEDHARVHKIGVTPDVLVEDDRAEKDEKFDPIRMMYRSDRTQDPVLDKALKILGQ